MLANLRNLALAEFRANNDSLTGLPNKRATEDTLKRMVAQAHRSVTPLTAVMLDLDHFKQINDRYGHGKGDEVLAAVGAAIRAALRGERLRRPVRRRGVPRPAARTTAVEGEARSRRGSARTIAAISVPGVDRDITASLGIAELLEHAGNAAGLLHEADRAQYAAKAGGRNRCVVAAQPEQDAPLEEPAYLSSASS